jgi:hypothetical protein
MQTQDNESDVTVTPDTPPGEAKPNGVDDGDKDGKLYSKADKDRFLASQAAAFKKQMADLQKQIDDRKTADEESDRRRREEEGKVGEVNAELEKKLADATTKLADLEQRETARRERIAERNADALKSLFPEKGSQPRWATETDPERLAEYIEDETSRRQSDLSVQQATAADTRVPRPTDDLSDEAKLQAAERQAEAHSLGVKVEDLP